MIKRVDTGKTRQTKIYKYEYYCDVCGRLLDKNNPKTEYIDGKKGKSMQVCKNNEQCNPFYQSKK